MTAAPILRRDQEYGPGVVDGAAPPAPSGDGPTAEAGSVARELARSYGELVESHRRAWGVGHEEADAKARGHGESSVEAARRDPPDEVRWWTLAAAMERDPAAATAAWERVKAEARAELATGHRTARALEWRGTPWERARFLALREAFAADWRPRGGVEAAPVDALAEAFTAFLTWSERATTQAETEWHLEDHKLRKDGYAQPPRLATGAYMDWTVAQAERAHTRFLRTLKAMQELRRLPGVSIASATQVNIGQQQAIVAAPSRGEADGGARDLPK